MLLISEPRGIGQKGGTVDFNDILVILLITAGATKAAAMFLARGASLSVADRRSVALQAVAIQAVVLSIFAARGENILHFFHVSVPALEVAGGLVLLLFAINLVLGEDHHDEPGEAGDTSMAVYPLAVPLLASPQAIVAVTIASTTLGPGHRGPLWLALGVVLAINLATMLFIAWSMGRKAPGAKKRFNAAPIVLRVVALLLCALAVEIMVLGLRGYGVMPPAPAATEAATSH